MPRMPITIVMSVDDQGYAVHLNESHGEINIMPCSKPPRIAQYPTSKHLKDLVKSCCQINEDGNVFHKSTGHRLGLSHYLEANYSKQTFGQNLPGSCCTNIECPTHSMTHYMNFWLPRDCQRLPVGVNKGFHLTQLILLAIQQFIHRDLILQAHPRTGTAPESHPLVATGASVDREHSELEPTVIRPTAQHPDQWRASLQEAVRHLETCMPSILHKIYGVERQTQVRHATPQPRAHAPTRQQVSAPNRMLGWFFKRPDSERIALVAHSENSNYGSIQQSATTRV